MLTDKTTTQDQAEFLPASPDAPSPFITEFFMVQGIGFRGMAYRDEQGVWRNAFTKEELPGEVRLIE